MNHAIVPKFANPHFFSQGYERTSRAEHTKYTEILPDNTQDDIDTLKRNLDELLHESWTDVLQSAQAVRDAEHSQVSGKRCKTAMCDLGASEDESVSFRLLSSMSNPQPISLLPKPQPVVCTREPEWEDSLNEAKERRRRARSVAVEFGSQWCTWDSPQRQANAKAFVTGGGFPVPPPSIVVTEESSLRTCAHSILVSRLKAANASRDAPSPHELKATCVPVIAVQASSGTTTTVARSSRRRRRRKYEQKKPPPTYWKPPAGLRGKCMGYALGYPSNWGNTSVPGGGYSRDVMKKGVYA